MNQPALISTHVEHYPFLHRGKVRETYDLGDRLLIIATDRISACDQIMPTGIPDKGRVLTSLSTFWFDKTIAIFPNHLISTDLDELPKLLPAERDRYAGRSMIVRKADRIDIECVVRGHIAGSAWVEYRDKGNVAGTPQPAGMLESEAFPQPVFTPAIKNDTGHDENISIAQLRAIVGSSLASRLEQASLDLYVFAYAYARSRGVIIADTKFEFGFAGDQLIVIDEMLTPDSSRFWDAQSFEPGSPQPSFDKQYLRDWLIASGWDREPPAPELPEHVVRGTIDRYREAYERLTGNPLVATKDQHQSTPDNKTEEVTIT